MKKRSLVEAALFVVAVLLLVGVSFLVIVGRRHSHHEIVPTLNLTQLQEAEYISSTGGPVDTIKIGNCIYEIVPYVGLNEYSKPYFLTDCEPGEVLAYFINDDRIFYYAEIKGLPYSNWMLCFREDGSGIPNMENIDCIYKSVDTSEIPEWIAEAKKASENITSTSN